MILCKYLFSFSLILAIVFPLKAQKNANDSFIPNQVSVYMEHFITSFNSGDTLLLENFIKESHHTKIIEQVPIKQLVYRLTYVYYQYGPLEARIYKSLSPTSAIVWTRGKLTKAWVGFQFFFTEKEPHKITTIGVDRGQFPPSEELMLPANNDMHLKKKVNKSINKLKNTPFFSGSVAVLHNNKTIIHKTLGFADKKSNIRNDANSLFLIASTSKMFVATAILQLKEKGLIKMDDILSKYIPEYPRNIADKVTIHHLLTHTSGIELDELPAFNNSVANSVKEMVDLQIKFMPQVKELVDYELPQDFNYTNEGYILLARIIEVVSGLDYWDYIDKNILKPIGMTNTYPIHLVKNKIVKGYTNRNPKDGSYIAAIPLERMPDNQSIASPSGGLVSTVQDLLKFGNALLSEKLISKVTLNEMTTLQISNYGYGVRIEETPAGKSFGHGGDILGYNCMLHIYPESAYIIAVLSNQDNAANNMAAYIKELLPRK